MRKHWDFVVHCLVLTSICALVAMPAAAFGQMRVTGLHCEYATNPVGIDVARPRLGWVLESKQRGDFQSAGQILVASGEELLRQDRGDLWDTGRTSAAESIHVEYGGRPLRSGQRAWWKVRVWDSDGRRSAWSEPAFWEMALEPREWTARWITTDRPLPEREEDFYADHPAPMFRKEFTAGKQVARARAYVSGLGYYELCLNGRRVGDHALDPGWTTYSQRVLYSTYDVTDLLREGRNAVGAIVGNGWYNPLPLRLWGKINLREHLTIGKPREEVYRFWRNLENLPRFAPWVRRVDVLDERRSEWEVEGPHGGVVHWESEITRDTPNEEIEWRTTANRSIANFGSVSFRDAPAGRGTIVRVHLEYVSPAGSLGAAVARLMGRAPQSMVEQSLRSLKQLLEAGEVATVDGQTSGRAGTRSRQGRQDEAGELADAQ